MIHYLNQNMGEHRMVDDEILKLAAFISISTYREKAVFSLGENVKIPTQISKDTGVLPNHISKVLTDLKKRDVGECINPEEKKGRLYRLTPMGMAAYKYLIENEKE